MKMLRLVIEFGRQRKKFDFKDPIDILSIENEIKSTFAISNSNSSEYLIQIFDEEVNDYLDLTSNSFVQTNNHLIKGQIISNQNYIFQPQVTKEQVVGLITLESIENSLHKWSQVLQHIQLEISKEIETVKQTVRAVKSHYKLIDESNPRFDSPLYPSVSNCSSPSTVSHSGNVDPPPPIFNLNQTNSQLIRPIPKIERKHSSGGFNGSSFNPIQSGRNGYNNSSQRTTSNTKASTNEEKNFCYPPSQVPSKAIEFHIPVIVTYQRFQSGVDFQGELSKYYNPSYFFLRICNQKESYDEMHQNINVYYNSIDSTKNYFPQSGEFCAAKSPHDSNWYRARIIRLVGNEKAQLIFVDSGDMSELNLNSIQPLNSQFSDRPAQALACTLAQILPLTQNDKCGWNRRSCMSLENAMKNERLTLGKGLLKVTVADNNQVKWPMMFIHISTASISNLGEHMCHLYLSRQSSNSEISEYWSFKIRPEQYVLFNLSSLINQKQYFLLNNQSTLSFDQTIDLIINDSQFLSRP